MSERVKFLLRELEPRENPAVFGQPWVDSATLSVSLVPDGTDVAGEPSRLREQFSGSTLWSAYGEIARALQTWSAVTNLNFHFSGDNGVPLGTVRPLQGDTSVGDIRISARPLSNNVLAITNPFDLVSNWSGEVILNSNVNFKAGSTDTGTHDLYTVMLQEIGHSLGLNNNKNINSVMYESYQGVRSGLSTEDVSVIQSLYGVRVNDAFENSSNGNGNNLNRVSEVTYITNPIDTAGSISLAAVNAVVTADITTNLDADYFKFTAPSTTNAPAIALLTSDLSLLRAKVTLWDTRTNQAVLTKQADYPSQNLLLDLNTIPGGMVAGREYLIKVEKQSSSGYDVGRYQLAVGNEARSLAGKLDVPGFATADRATPFVAAGGTLSSAANLGTARPRSDGRWDVYGRADFYKTADVDVYKISTQSDTGRVMVVSAWVVPGSGAIPRVRVTDASGNTLTSQAIRVDNNVAVIQIEGVQPSTTYYVHVSQIGTWSSGTPIYWLGLDFRNTAIQLNTLATGEFTSSQNYSEARLKITRSQLIRFEVSATSSHQNASKLEILDESGRVRFTLVAQNGQTRSADAFLMPGTYTVRISGIAGMANNFTAARTTVRFLPLTDPIGPEVLDPIAPIYDPTLRQSPPYSPPPPPPSYDPSDLGFLWDPILSIDPLAWWW